MPSAVLTPEQLQHASVRLSAGRIKAMQKAPYLSTALLALSPKARVGLETFAVDTGWNMYYDPALCLKWSTDEIAAVWLHEVNHVIRQHAKRYEAVQGRKDPRAWNISADAAINYDLKNMGILLPDPDVRYYADRRDQCSGWTTGMTAEQLYKEYVRSKHGDNENNDTFRERDDGPPEPEGDTDENDANSEGIQPNEPEGANADNTREEDDAEEGSQGGDPGEGDEGSESDSPGGSGEGGNQDQDGTPESLPGAHNDPSDQSPEGEGEDGSGHGEDDLPGGGCGSGADGVEREYEEPADSPDRLDDGQVDIVLKETARQIKEFDNLNPGVAPGSIVRTAEDILDPKVDWRRLLMVKVRQGLQQAAGKHDYSYTRPSRRYSSSQFVFPGMRGGYKPTVYVVLDTSGSMTESDLTRALSEVAGMVRRVRGNIFVIPCDAAASEVQAVRAVDTIQIVGGGGTDMRVGMKQAAESKPKPDIIVVITDGGTPWDSTPPDSGKKVKYIALVVKANKASRGTRRGDWMTKNIPEFIEVIEVDR